MRSLTVAGIAGAMLLLAFPPYGQAYLTVPAVALLLWALRSAPSRGVAIWSGSIFGLVFFGFLFPWLTELGLVAFVPLWLMQSAYFAGIGWVVWRARGLVGGSWVAVVAGLWAGMEFLRGRFPLGGFEWGFLGYPMGEYSWTRGATQWIGTTGWSVVLVAVAAALVHGAASRRWALAASGTGVAALLTVAGGVFPSVASGPAVDVAIVQGSTPCPGSHCENERFRTYETHLALTRSLAAGSVDLIVWPEGSTGGFSADPVLDPAVGEAIGAEARRIDAVMLVGGDRPLSDTEWANANVVFDETGTIVGEYRKRHPVPFGEYVPARPLFDWIPALAAVPRDMVRGDGPRVFDVFFGRLGSVVSWEGSFARFSRDEVKAGAQVLVVATNQGSYPFSVASDQLIGMTRMRAAELGVDLVHAGVVGRSTLITGGGEVGPATGLATSEILTGSVRMRTEGPTLYGRLGDWLQWMAVVTATALAVALRVRTGRS
ncbi:MAG: apolipoprotein N-acyltransferase [Acidimicrobiia bacterium]|nr:apolipoprotein N-acyltransferase [Acidimicrobiia bacterium]MDH4307408.1 apolipoprotein N-acyltransferase [Acidimicrobiia bacterium]MDH5292496.1 apolipoprotein N-acyltransferase [Acidimicrobiia bacterium]